MGVGSLAMDPTGAPRVAYTYYNPTSLLFELHYQQLTLAGVVVTDETLGNAASGPFEVNGSVTAVRSDGLGVIAWDNGTNLVQVLCGTAQCALTDTPAPTFTTVDSTGDWGSGPSIAIGPSDSSYIPYQQLTDGLVHLAVLDASGAITTDTVIPGTLLLGALLDVAVLPSGNAYVAVPGASSETLDICSDTACTSPTQVLFGVGGSYLDSIALDSSTVSITAENKLWRGNSSFASPTQLLLRQSANTVYPFAPLAMVGGTWQIISADSASVNFVYYDVTSATVTPIHLGTDTRPFAGVVSDWLNLANGTIVFSNQFAGTATDGIQEAINAAGANGRVVIPPGNHPITAQIVLHASNVEIDGYGAKLICNVAANCFVLGDPTNVNAYTDATIKGLQFSPGANSAGQSALEVNTFRTHMYDLQAIPNGSFTFGNVIQIDDDQGFAIDHFSVNGGVVDCTAAHCGALIYSPQGGAFSGEGTISDSFLDTECQGNSIDWGGGSVTALHTVMQAFNQFAFRAVADQSGGPSDITIEGGNIEGGSCTNPAGNVGSAGVLVQGRRLRYLNTNMAGAFPEYTLNGTPGTTYYHYYAVADGPSGKSGPLAIGYVGTGNATIDGTNSVNIVWPDIDDSVATTFDLIRISGGPTGGAWHYGSYQAPYGTGNLR